MLCFWVDHAVFFGNQEPGRLRLPGRLGNRLLDTLQCDWPLYRCRQCDLLRSRMMCEGISKSFLWHPDKTVSVWRKLRALGMSLITIENLSDSLALVGSQCCDIHQSLHALFIHRANDGARVGMARQDNRPVRARQCAFHCGNVVTE